MILRRVVPAPAGLSPPLFGPTVPACRLRLPPRGSHDGAALSASGYELLEGMLLVTPAPGSAHQGVLSRLHLAVSAYLAPLDLAWVASPGEIEIAPKTLLDPDLLVVPASYPPGTSWRSMRDWWLAVEIFSPSSKIYDRDFKRDAYLSLGVGEVWLVDIDERAIFVSQGSDRDVKHTRAVVWHPSRMPAALEIELASVFRGIV